MRHLPVRLPALLLCALAFSAAFIDARAADAKGGPRKATLAKCPRLEIAGVAAIAPTAPAACTVALGLRGDGAATGTRVVTPRELADPARPIDGAVALAVIDRVLVLGAWAGEAGPDDVYKDRGATTLALARTLREAAPNPDDASATSARAALESAHARALLAQGRGATDDALCTSTTHGLLALFDLDRIVIPAADDAPSSTLHCGGRVIALARDARIAIEGGGVSEQRASATRVLDRSDAAVEEFLRTATVVAREDAERGITKPLKVTLERDGEKRRALFKAIDVRKDGWNQERDYDPELVFEDSFRFEIAAYRLDRYLDTGMVPVAVERDVGSVRGVLIEWIDDAMTEPDRATARLAPLDPRLLVVQRETMRIFDTLILNTDRTTYNQLYTVANWRLHAIDHSRSFRRNDGLPPEWDNDLPARITTRLHQALGTLTKESLQALLGDLIDKLQIRAMLKRRDALLARIENDRKRLGDAVVFVDGAGVMAATPTSEPAVPAAPRK